MAVGCDGGCVRNLNQTSGPVYTKGQRRYLHEVWPLVYTETLFLIMVNDYF